MSEPAQPPDIAGLLSQAVQMQQEVMAAQAAASEAVVEGAAGGGAVVIAVTGGMEFRSVWIDPTVVDPDDPELLADLVLAALRDAMAKVNELQAQSLGGLGDLMGGGGLGDLGGLGGLLGGDDSAQPGAGFLEIDEGER